MGIKSSFNSFLRDTCPDVFEPIHISEYSFKKVAIDISLYLHKYKAVCGDRWLSAFINLIASLRRNEIHCVFIFDGKAPVEKSGEQEKRRDTRDKLDHKLYELEEALADYNKTGIVAKCIIDIYSKSKSPKRLLGNRPGGVDMLWVEKKIKQRRGQLYDVSPKDFEDARELFTILKVPFYTAPGEAEKMCSAMCISGFVSAVLSEDTDVIAYGAPIFLSKIDTSSDTCVRITNSQLIDSLSLNRTKFLDLCIMCGTDYNSNISKIGSKTSYKKVLEYGGIDEISLETSLDVSVLNHVRVRQLFTDFSCENQAMIKIPYCGVPDFSLLEKFVSSRKIHLNIDKLCKDFTHNVVVFEGSEDEVDHKDQVENEVEEEEEEEVEEKEIEEEVEEEVEV
jgi:5'-3' exonuclease